jgi:hypothetical protein
LDQAFPIKQLPKSTGSKEDADASEGDDAGRSSRFRSALSLQIKQFPSQPNNPFSEYAQFDGRVCDSRTNVKRISIFLTMVDEDRDKPMDVSVVSGARVEDLIGLICWHYTNEGRKPSLRHDSVTHYGLRISEDGEIDPDFPALDKKAFFAKFGFSTLCFVEEEDVSTGVVVTV